MGLSGFGLWLTHTLQSGWAQPPPRKWAVQKPAGPGTLPLQGSEDAEGHCKGRDLSKVAPRSPERGSPSSRTWVSWLQTLGLRLTPEELGLMKGGVAANHGAAPMAPSPH